MGPGVCSECSASTVVRFWRLDYGRSGITHRDVKESFDSGEPPSGYRPLGTAEFQLCDRCERRLLWERFRTLADNPWRSWPLLVLAALATFALAGSLGDAAFTLLPILIGGLGVMVYLGGWLRRNPETTKALLLDRHRRTLALRHQVDPQRLTLERAPPR